MSDSLVHGDFDVADRIARACKTFFNRRVDRVIHREVDREFVGGFLYSDFTRESCQIHMYGVAPGWCSRFMLWVAFDYPFNQLGVNRVFGNAPETCLHALGIQAKAGFNAVTYIPGVYQYGVGKVITVLVKEDCRFLKLGARYRQEEPVDG